MMASQRLYDKSKLFPRYRYASTNECKKESNPHQAPLMIQQSNTFLCGGASTDAVFVKNANDKIHSKTTQTINEFKHINQFKKEWKKGKQIGWGGQGSVFEVTRIVFNSCYHNIQRIHYVAKVMYFLNEDIYESIEDRQEAVYSVINEFKLVKKGKLLNYTDLYYDKRNYTKAIIIMKKLSYSLSSKRFDHDHNSHSHDKKKIAYVKQIAKDLANNIKEIHDLQYVHLDIKKENVMWNATDRKWKIIDYGLARYIDPKKNYIKHKGFVGSKSWTSPEIMLCESTCNKAMHMHYSILSKKCDIYSYGLVILNVILGGDHYGKIMNECFEYCQLSEIELLKVFATVTGNGMLQKHLMKLRKNRVIEWRLYVFLTQLLRYNHYERPSIDEVLDMDYLRNNTSELINI